MAKDELLRLTGTTGNAEETVTANGNGSAVYVGADRLLLAELRVGGAVTGTTPTLSVKIQESPDGSGSWVDLVTFETVSATMQTSGGDGPGTGPLRVGFRTTKPYIRVVKTVTGTTPSFAATSVTLEPAAAVAA